MKNIFNRQKYEVSFILILALACMCKSAHANDWTPEYKKVILDQCVRGAHESLDNKINNKKTTVDTKKRLLRLRPYMKIQCNCLQSYVTNKWSVIDFKKNSSQVLDFMKKHSSEGGKCFIENFVDREFLASKNIYTGKELIIANAKINYLKTTESQMMSISFKNGKKKNSIIKKNIHWYSASINIKNTGKTDVLLLVNPLSLNSSVKFPSKITQVTIGNNRKNLDSKPNTEALNIEVIKPGETKTVSAKYYSDKKEDKVELIYSISDFDNGLFSYWAGTIKSTPIIASHPK